MFQSGLSTPARLARTEGSTFCLQSQRTLFGSCTGDPHYQTAAGACGCSLEGLEHDTGEVSLGSGCMRG